MQLIESTLDHEMSEIKFGYALFVLSCLKIYATLARSTKFLFPQQMVET